LRAHERRHDAASGSSPPGAAIVLSGWNLALQLLFLQVSESMGNHDSKIMDAASVD
jgi:hypothetical protein